VWREDNMKSTKIALLLVLFVGAMTAQAQQDVQVFVPGNASGGFGNPIDQVVPLVAALAAAGPGTITVTYVSGTVTDSGVVDTGPNGVPWDEPGLQFPLQEAKGVSRGRVNNLDALIGAFVPRSRVDHSGFNPIDGTKNLTRVGLLPSRLFLIGEGITLDVREAGTLFLGINDMHVGGNSGGFNVEVTGP